MEKKQKFKVTATGEVIKVKAIQCLKYKDVKTGKIYDIGELERIPEKHCAVWGFHIKRFGIYFYAREYWKYKSFQFGLSFDYLNGKDKALDVELKFACAGIGTRFIILTK